MCLEFQERLVRGWECLWRCFQGLEVVGYEGRMYMGGASTMGSLDMDMVSRIICMIMVRRLSPEFFTIF